MIIEIGRGERKEIAIIPDWAMRDRMVLEKFKRCLDVVFYIGLNDNGRKGNSEAARRCKRIKRLLKDGAD